MFRVPERKEYRLATYNKVKIRKLSNNQILVQQGDLILEISLQPSDEHTLFARTGKYDKKN